MDVAPIHKASMPEEEVRMDEERSNVFFPNNIYKSRA
jgi:hypothetical protein